MIGFKAKLVGRPPSVEKIVKNINFGTAVGLTKTAKEGQAAVVGALKGTFTLRGRWFEPGNKFGIKIRPATAARLRSEVYTLADWLEIHETGGTKTARSGRLAVPTENVRRNKRMIIQKGQRPRNLADAFVIQTRKGPVIFRRQGRGRNKKLVALYGIEQSARIKKQPTFGEPIKKVVARRLERNIRQGIDNALRTMR